MTVDEIRQSLALEFGEDRMRAIVRARTDRPPRGLSSAELLRFLENCGIQHGLDRDTVRAMLASWKRGQTGPWLVAEGTPAVPGRPEGLQRLKPPPRSGEDDVELLPLYVKRGDRLFKVRGPSEPTPGTDVCGKSALPPPTPQPASLQAGKGIVIEDGVWIARASGFLHAGESQLRIIKTLVHFHDLGEGTYRWPADAQITGSISPGVTLEVGGNLVIEGDVGVGAHLHADGDLRIEGVIHGGGKTKIEAEGRIQIRSAEAATITGGSDVVITEKIVDCRVRSRAVVHASEEGCCVLGGAIEAIAGSEVFNVGPDQGRQATISVGRASWINEDMRTVEAEIRRWALYHSKLFEDFRKQHGSHVENRSLLWQIPEKERDQFYADEEEVLAEQQRVDQRISRLRTRLEALAGSRAVDARAVIQVHGTVDGASKLTVRGRRYESGRKPLQGVTIGIYGDSKRVCAVPTALFQSSEML